MGRGEGSRRGGEGEGDTQEHFGKGISALFLVITICSTKLQIAS